MEIRKETGERYTRQMVRVVMDRFDASLNAFGAVHSKVARRYDMYRGTFTGRFHSQRNNVHVPLLFSVIQSDVARKMNTLFGSWPYVNFHGVPHVARKNDILVSEQLDEADIFRKSVDFILSAELYGTAVIQYGWQYTEALRPRRQVFEDSFGRRAETVETETVVDFDGPDIEVVDCLDAFPQPSRSSIRDMNWFIRRYWMDFDEVRAEAQEPDGTFEPSAIKELKLSHPGASKAMDYDERRSLYRSSLDAASRDADPLARPIEIIEMWGVIPDELVPEDGAKNRVITVANGRVLLRNSPNPYWSGEIPFLSYSPMQDPHYFHAPGKIEIAERLQASANRLASQQLDVLDLIVDPMWLVDRSKGIDLNRLFSRTGRVIEVDGPVTDTMQPIFPDLRGMQLGWQEIGLIWKQIQQGSGIVEDTVMGGGSTKRQTAREFLGRQEAVSNRLLLEARLAEEGFIEPLAMAFRALNRQYLDVPREVAYAGPHALRNVVTGEETGFEQISVDFEDIELDLKKVRARGATQFLSKAARQENLFRLMQMATVNPAAATLVNWANFLRYTFIEHDMPIDELLNTPEEAIAANLQILGTKTAPPAAEGGGAEADALKLMGSAG